MRRLVLGLAAAAVVAVAAGVTGWAWRMHVDATPKASAASSRIGGPFALVDVDGRPVTDRDLLGKPTLVYFGFTYCPEVCPTTLAAMTQWMKALGPDANKLNAVFISIDPERDTPKQLKQYLAAFDPRIRGLTGTPEQVARAAHQYLVFYQKVDLGGGNYTMDHSTTVYLMDRQGHMADVIAYQEPAADAVDTIRQALKATS
jgi:protein SCO1/2